MRRAALAAVLCLSSAALAQPPAPDPAGRAIDEAVKVLEKALPAVKGNADKARIEQAINTLKDSRRSDLNADAAAFADAPLKFKGRTLTLVGKLAKIDDPGSRDTSDLGVYVKFLASNPKNGDAIPLVLNHPKHIKRPGVSKDDDLIVTFEVRQGETYTGNVIKAVRVP